MKIDFTNMVLLQNIKRTTISSLHFVLLIMVANLAVQIFSKPYPQADLNFWTLLVLACVGLFFYGIFVGIILTIVNSIRMKRKNEKEIVKIF